MKLNVILGVVLAVLAAITIFLLFASGNHRGNGNNYAPPAAGYNMQGQMPQGQMPQGQAPQGQPPQWQQRPEQQAKSAPPAPPIKQIAPPKTVVVPAPTAPAPALVSTKNMAELFALINSFGNPIAPDETRGCYVRVREDTGYAMNDLAEFNEKCLVTPYADGSYMLTRMNGEPFFNLYGGPISAIRVDPITWQEMSLLQPRTPGFTIGLPYWVAGPGGDCVQAGDSGGIEVMVCTPTP